MLILIMVLVPVLAVLIIAFSLFMRSKMKKIGSA
jgi:hypothetical protein